MKNLDLLKESYDFDLDASLIADRPIMGRHNSKLLVYNQQTGEITHTQYKYLAEFLSPNHTLVFNQSKVFPCRLLGQKASGGKIELFLLSLLATDNLYSVMLRSNGKKNIGDQFKFDELIATIEKRSEAGDFLVSFNLKHDELLSFFQRTAHIPIPPYIRQGIADEKDISDYQTVYAKELGSVAAPTAGLHFTQDIFNSLNNKGIKKAFVTLHVGAGTFKPVGTDNILEHKMHQEYFDIEGDQLDIINQAKDLIAVGTTSLRVLESCYSKEKIALPKGATPHSTDIFLHPGKEVKSIRGLITNFHLPKSTLLMLVSAIIGREKALDLYALAIENNYRFFSYGDGMLILR
ncbi:MAG: tRNA preQ1(34) S-adenosylmethionine ribosyltransferase-isomerase QueA [Halobacteriovoraceae bacterium]|jgi:S-adenosylmethionine:tRNA ribosyltransferase-isomerase|nr:tRNA preQ1(34) S-adenosylmethionine ribosyltransferase-isomerase QueA [Halobacteriovoraceae bacterium]